MRRAICQIVLPLWPSAGLRAGTVAPRYQVEYATYFGGKPFDQAREIIVYPDGSVLVGGQTKSSD